MVLFSLLSDICSCLLPNPRNANLRSYYPALWQEIISEHKVLHLFRVKKASMSMVMGTLRHYMIDIRKYFNLFL